MPQIFIPFIIMFQFFLSNFVRLNRIIIIDEIYKLELDIKGRKTEIVLSRKFNSNKIEVSSNSGGTNLIRGLTLVDINTAIVARLDTASPNLIYYKVSIDPIIFKFLSVITISPEEVPIFSIEDITTK